MFSCFAKRIPNPTQNIRVPHHHNRSYLHLTGFAGRDVTFTETRDEIARLRREDASLFEEAGPSALSGEEYRRALERELAHPLVRTAILDLPWGAGARFVRTGAHQPGIVFCARIADYPKPWFRYVPLTPALQPQADEAGQAIVIDDTLTCLSHADPGGLRHPQPVRWKPCQPGMLRHRVRRLGCREGPHPLRVDVQRRPS